MNIKILIKKHWATALFVILLVIFVYYKTWWGVGGLILFITVLQIARLVFFFKSMPWLKNLMLDHIKKWEAAQLGHDLDSEYWDGKQRPTRLQKFRGIDPNISMEENKRRKEINKEIVKQLSVKQKYFSMFDYKTGSKAIYLFVAITLAIYLLKIGWNLLIVFGLIFALGFLKKRIDSKLLSK